MAGGPRPIGRLGLVDPTDFSRDKNSSPPIGWCRWHVRHTPKKNGRRSGGRGAQISAQCWCGSAELINLTTIVGPALFPIGEQERGWPLVGSGPAIRNCIMRSTILLKLERKHKSWLKLVLAPIGDRRPSFMVAVEATAGRCSFCSLRPLKGVTGSVNLDPAPQVEKAFDRDAPH